MAIAGKVSIVPMGEWQSTEVYTRLDLVTYNRNAYLSLKNSTGIQPINAEYWMLLVENVANTEIEALQTQIDDIVEDIADIINGTTPVEKAEDSQKLNGLTAGNFYRTTRLLNNAFAIDANTLVNEGNYFVIFGKNVPNSHGFVEVRYYNGALFAPDSGKGETKCVRQVFYPYANGLTKTRYGLFYVDTSTDWKFSEWINIADGGNADTVDGQHVGENGKKGLVKVSSDYGVTEIGNYLDFHNQAGNDYDIRLGIENGELVLRNPEKNITSQVATNKYVRDNYVPLDGSVAMSGFFAFNNGLGRLKTANGEWLTLLCNEVADVSNISNCRYIQINTKVHNATKGLIDKALQLRDVTDNVEANYDILHTGSSSPVKISATAPTNTTALWIDTTNKVIKAYIDGAWTQVN